jgi:hypothetical protein
MHAYDLFRWLLAIVFGLFGCWIILLNFAIVYRWYAHRKHHSWIPLLGGFLACFGMLACPLRQVQRFALMPLMVDIGYVVCVLTIGYATMLFRWLWREEKNDA